MIEVFFGMLYLTFLLISAVCWSFIAIISIVQLVEKVKDAP